MAARWGPTLKKESFADLFLVFQKILHLNNRILELAASTGDKLGGNYVFDQQYIKTTCRTIAGLVQDLVQNLDLLAPRKYSGLVAAFEKINAEIEAELSGHLVLPTMDLVMPYAAISRDFADLVGAKNANLAEIGNSLSISIPEGFAITTQAYLAFWEHNALQPKVTAIVEAWENNRITTHEAEQQIQSLILAGTIPVPLKKAVRKAIDELVQSQKSKQVVFAFRSSDRIEDTEHTFAGQHISLLNERAINTVKCYKTVLASIFSASAMEYRRQKGILNSEILMSVGCQIMVDAKVSGVVYTVDPVSPQREVMIVSAAWGLGMSQADGQIRTDRFEVDRNPPHAICSLNIVRKREKVTPNRDCGIELEAVASELQTQPCLTTEQLKRLTETALAIERFFMKSQDIEFAFDQEDRLVVLQSRPLSIKSRINGLLQEIGAVLKGYPVLFAGKGEVAQQGIGTGRVFFVTNEADLESFPHGGILVAKQSSPQFARIIHKTRGIITDMGSATGHMATIAREFRVPAIVGAEIATLVLRQGQEITVDATEKTVYKGIVKELSMFHLGTDDFDATYEYRLLRRVLKKIEPLHLLDPNNKNFTPTACRTFHDITRFVHEKAVEEIIGMNFYHHPFPKKNAKKLTLKIPLDLILIDLGDGFLQTTTARSLSLEMVASEPLLAFVAGLQVPGVWNSDAVSVDFSSFMSSFTRTTASAIATPKYIGQNLAVVSKQYANISLRLGYHFTMIDSYLSDTANDNYIYFRFLGGVTETVRRSRRAKFLSGILEKDDFLVDLKKDLVVARIKKLPKRIMIKKMHLLGLLVAFTRQLDVSLVSEDRISKSINDFNRFRKYDTATSTNGA